jgi:hypothetical protein
MSNHFSPASGRRCGPPSNHDVLLARVLESLDMLNKLHSIHIVVIWLGSVDDARQLCRAPGEKMKSPRDEFGTGDYG